MTSSNYELEATIYALGYLEDGKYYKSKDCLNAAKDLIRYLRRDDENQMSTRRELLKADIITNDLIPIIKDLKISNPKDKDLFDVVLRLLVNLSQSAIMCFNNELPTDKFIRNIFIEVDNYLQKAKVAFADEAFTKTLCLTLIEILNKDWEHRPEEENCIIERIFFLIRNILFIKNVDSDNADLTHNIHDTLIKTLHSAGLFDVLINVCNTNKHSLYSLHVLDILKLILREQNPNDLAKVNEWNMSKRSEFEKEKDDEELLRIKKKDEHLRNNGRLRLNSRHSRFAGTYVASNVKSINDTNYQICHKTAKTIDELLGDETKKVKRKPKNRVPLEEADENQHKSQSSVRVILMKFCKDIVKKAYKNLMHSLNMHMQRKSLEDDQVYSYFWLIRFLMEFNRNSDTQVQAKFDEIKETFSLEIMHSILVQIDRCEEMIRLEKKQIHLWSKRLHIALQCFKEYLLTLSYFDKVLSENTAKNFEDNNAIQIEILTEESKELLVTIKNQVFYIQEFRELMLNMLKDYDDTKLPLSLLKDLVEANNTFLEIFENYTKENGEIQVQSKKKARKQTKKSEKKIEISEEDLEKEKEEREKMFNQLSEKISEKLKLESNELQTNDEQLFPFDFANEDCEDDSKKDEVILQIQKYVKEDKLDHALALFREARYIWSNEKDLFGYTGITLDEEYEKFKDIFLRQINEDELNQKKNEQNVDEKEETQNDDEDEMNDESSYMVKEERLDYLKFLSRYAHPHVVRCHVCVLKDYQKNSDYVTMCCLNMFKRICNDCQLHEYLYQLNLFYLINKMYKDPLKNYLNEIDSSSSQKMFEFFQELLKKFFDAQQENAKMVLELLHFKNSRYMSEMINGPKEKSLVKAKCWTTEEDEELKNLFDALKSNEDENKFERGDMVDNIMIKIKDGTRSRRDITNQLLKLDLVKSKDELENKKRLGRSRIWRDEDIEDLRENFEQFKNDENILNKIKNSLKIKRSNKEITCKLLEINLISSKSELKSSKDKSDNKRSRKKKDKKSTDNDELFTHGDSSDDDLLNSSVDDSTTDDEIDKTSEKKEETKDNPKDETAEESINLGLHLSDDDDDESLSLVDLNRKKESPKITKSPKKSSFFSDIIEPKRKKRVKTLDSEDENMNNSKENNENVPDILNDDSSNDKFSSADKPNVKRQRLAILSDSE